MTSHKMLFLAMTMAFACALSATPSEGYFFSIDGNDTSTEREEKTPLRGANRLLGNRRVMTCDKYPRVCEVEGSRGPDCCHKKCVDASRDRNSCGKCGNKCKYSEICCKGNCVNPMADKNHCGGCGNKCQSKGDYCQHGMCNYAYA